MYFLVYSQSLSQCGIFVIAASHILTITLFAQRDGGIAFLNESHLDHKQVAVAEWGITTVK